MRAIFELQGVYESDDYFTLRASTLPGEFADPLAARALKHSACSERTDVKVDTY
jgi:hypothetical protein